MRGWDQGHFRCGLDLIVVVDDELDGRLLQGVGVVKVGGHEVCGGVDHGDRVAKAGERRSFEFFFAGYILMKLE
jgi:hypothetical protein